MKNVVDAIPAIRKIAAQELPMKTLYRAKRLLDALEAHLRFYDEARETIMSRCCDIADGRYIPKPGMAKELEDKMRELLEVELDMDGVTALKLPADDGMKLSYADLCALCALDGLIEIDFGEGKDESGETA